MRHLLFLIALAASAQQIKINPITGLPDLTGSGVTAGTGLVCVGSTCSVDTAVIQSRATEQAGTSTYCRSTTGNATMTCALTPTLTAYTTGMCLVLNADFANVTTATLNVDALTAKSVLGPFGSALAAGDIPANQPVQVCYNGTAFIKQGYAQSTPDGQMSYVSNGAGAGGTLSVDDGSGGRFEAGVDGNGYFKALSSTASLFNQAGPSENYIYSQNETQTANRPLWLLSSILYILNDAASGTTDVQVQIGSGQTSKSVVLTTGGRMKAPLTTPTTSGETCTAGTFTADTSYVYVCTAANTWKRAALSAF